MSTTRAHNRRRSTSDSPPPIPWQHRPSKRAYTPQTSPSPDMLSKSWDVDMWRREAKRARRDISPSSDMPPIGHTSSSSTDNQRFTPSIVGPPLASTSAEFNFFQNNNRRQRQSPQSISRSSNKMGYYTPMELTRMRADAFWDLRKTIAQNDEGMIRRMRDYETSRSRLGSNCRSKAAYGRSKKRSSSVYPRRLDVSNDDDDDDDDVQIFAGDSSGLSYAHPRKKRALSLGVMNVDHDSGPSPFAFPSIGESERSSSPAAICDSDPSDDYDFLSPEIAHNLPPGASGASTSRCADMESTPALSHTLTNSTNSSLISLPLPSPLPAATSIGVTHCSSLPTSFSSPRLFQTCSLPPATRSEKAIAALSLAMANGAGSLNDYDALRSLDPPSALDEHYEVGELWH